MTPHDHTTLVPGCFRCELGQDEARDSASDFPTQAVRCPRCDVEHSPSLPHGTVEDCNAALVGTRILNLEAENATLRGALEDRLRQGQDDYQSIDNLGRAVSRLRSAASDLISAYMAGDALGPAINALEDAAGLGQQG